MAIFRQSVTSRVAKEEQLSSIDCSHYAGTLEFLPGVRDTMRHYLRHHKGIAAISAFGAFLVFCWFWDLSASIRGHLDARIDVNRGRYQLLGYGLPSPSHPEYVR